MWEDQLRVCSSMLGKKMMVAWNQRYNERMRSGQILVYFIVELAELADGLVISR